MASCHAWECSGVGPLSLLAEVTLASLPVINTELGFHARYDNKREIISLIFDTEAENLEFVVLYCLFQW